jgi:hypothetical protein
MKSSRSIPYFNSNKIDRKAELPAEIVANSERRAQRKLQTAAARNLHRAGVAARKAERQRRKRVAFFRRAGTEIPEELQNPIEDPEALAQAENEAGSESDGQSDSDRPESRTREREESEDEEEEMEIRLEI